MDFKERLNKIGVKQIKLAEYLGINNTYLSNLLNYNNNLSQEKTDKINHFLTQYEKIQL